MLSRAIILLKFLRKRQEGYIETAGADIGKIKKRDTEDKKANNNKDFYYDLVIDKVTFNISDYREMETNLHLPTTYFSTPTETMEVFAHLKLYSNKNLHYKLFNDRGRTYIIKNLIVRNSTGACIRYKKNFISFLEKIAEFITQIREISTTIYN